MLPCKLVSYKLHFFYYTFICLSSLTGCLIGSFCSSTNVLLLHLRGLNRLLVSKATYCWIRSSFHTFSWIVFSRILLDRLCTFCLLKTNSLLVKCQCDHLFSCRHWLHLWLVLLQGCLTSTALKTFHQTAWSSCASTMQMRNCTSCSSETSWNTNRYIWCCAACGHPWWSVKLSVHLKWMLVSLGWSLCHAFAFFFLLCQLLWRLGESPADYLYVKITITMFLNRSIKFLVLMWALLGSLTLLVFLLCTGGIFDGGAPMGASGILWQHSMPEQSRWPAECLFSSQWGLLASDKTCLALIQFESSAALWHWVCVFHYQAQ